MPDLVDRLAHEVAHKALGPMVADKATRLDYSGQFFFSMRDEKMCDGPASARARALAR